ncbi:MAG: hypothetical protein KAS72_08905 [Phycisphaerales bacterium]|nr:hypothetical protein [Phycisphaerales bacterium]
MLRRSYHFRPTSRGLHQTSTAHAADQQLRTHRHVDQYDLGILLAWYGRDRWGDIDGDGDTDAEDLGILLGYYGQPCEPR